MIKMKKNLKLFLKAIDLKATSYLIIISVVTDYSMVLSLFSDG